jgi:hypothetical protein
MEWPANFTLAQKVVFYAAGAVGETMYVVAKQRAMPWSGRGFPVAGCAGDRQKAAKLLRLDRHGDAFAREWAYRSEQAERVLRDNAEAFGAGIAPLAEAWSLDAKGIYAILNRCGIRPAPYIV